EGTPLEFVVPGGDEGFVGMFVRLAKDGRGAVSAQKVTAVINLNPEPRTPNPEIRAFGIEMAYVAEGPFYLGSSVRRINCFYGYQESGTHTPPYRVTGAGAIPTGKQKGKLWALGFRPEDNGQIPAAFPNGYAAFYCMKFPCLTQGFYADFLNTLTVAQAKKRWYVEGQGKEIARTGTAPDYTYTATAPDARTAWLSWEDYAMVAAWAGLRPLTELEFEKAVRGLDAPEGADVGLSFYGLQEVNGGDIYERQVTVSTAEGRKFAGTHGRGIVELPLDWPSAVKDGVVYRGNYFRYRKYCSVGHLGTAGRSAECNGKSDRFSASHEGQDELIAGCRIARTAPAGDTIAAAGLAARFDATVVRPLVRLTAPVKVDTWTEGMGKPIAVLGTTETLFPVNSRCLIKNQERVLWNGPADLSGKAYLAWDGEALLVGAEVTDDQHVNTQKGDSLWNGDALQFGVVTPKGVHWNLAVALTTKGVAVHQFMGGSDVLLRTMDCSVTRDDKTNITRYGVRLPLAAIGLAPGDTFGFDTLICDGDDSKGMRHNMRMAEGISYPFRPELYPRFVLAK
ncbi:MAG: sugar-binding protein, partial [Kiritimatiellia bacterium]